MNVLFLTLLSFDSLQERNIYTDLLREFVKNEHMVYAISPTEKRQNQGTRLIKEDNATILRLQIGNTQKTTIIEKGIAMLMSRVMLQDLQLNYNHFYKTISKDNIPSVRVAEKCEFHAESECVKTRWLHTIQKTDNGQQYLYTYSIK